MLPHHSLSLQVQVYQYVLLRLICTIIILIAEANHAYHESFSDPVYAATAFIINVSQMYALYVLALFYLELKADLKPLAPLGKFMVIKVRDLRLSMHLSLHIHGKLFRRIPNKHSACFLSSSLPQSVIAMIIISSRRCVPDPSSRFPSWQAVVFVSWWQGVAITGAAAIGLMPKYEQYGWSEDDVAKGLQVGVA